jgi:hypothetical protein
VQGAEGSRQLARGALARGSSILLAATIAVLAPVVPGSTASASTGCEAVLKSRPPSAVLLVDDRMVDQSTQATVSGIPQGAAPTNPPGTSFINREAPAPRVPVGEENLARIKQTPGGASDLEPSVSTPARSRP